MKTIMLACSAGMSTSILVGKIKTEIINQKLDFDVIAIPTTEAILRWREANIILLGPQVRYELPKFEKEINGIIPVLIIDQISYGTGNGAKILQVVLETLKK